MAVLSLLQLDTGFPRIAGDVGCRETFRAELDIHVLDDLSVARVVTPDPQADDMDRLGAVLSAARGDVITTSCGFLSVWQDRLAARAPALVRLAAAQVAVALALAQVEQAPL